MVSDLKHATRMLLGRPSFSAVAIATLALGIGAAVAIFSIVDGVLLRPLPVAAPERLVVIWETHPSLRVPFMATSPPQLAQWRGETAMFDEVGGFASTRLTIADSGVAEQVTGATISPGLMQALGVAPALGRFFTDEEHRVNGPRAVLLSDALWRRRFAADAGMVGRPVRLSGNLYTVTGVMPAAFNFLPSITIEGKPPLQRSEFWVPQAMDNPSQQRGARFLIAIGRLRPGVTLAAAERHLHDLAVRNAREGLENAGWDVRLVPVLEQATASVKPTLLTLLGAVGIVLLLACTNVANLLLARGVGRRREIAVRAALGAGRWRLARQLLTESLLLAGAGAGAGLLVAGWAVRFARAYGPATVTRLDEASIDLRVLAFATGVALAAAVLTALAPLAQMLRPSADWLKERGGSSSAGGASLRSMLVVSEIALALVLLVAGALLMESFLRLRSASPGFVPRHALTFRAALPPDRYPTRIERNRFASEFVRRLSAAAGIAAAGAIDSVPIGEDRQGTGFAVEGAAASSDDTDAHTGISFPGPGYFEAIGLPLLRGRTFVDADRADAPPVAIVNDLLARQAFGTANPVGRRIRVGFNRQIVREVIGVVADDHHTGVGRPAMPNVYLPYEQVGFTGGLSFVVRTTSEVATTIATVRRELNAVDAEAAIYNVRTLEQIVSDSMSTERFATLLLAVFAAVALALAVVGIYGVTDEAVSQRAPELGIRMALGAEPARILRLVVGGGVRLTAAGVAIGIAAAIGVSRFLATRLFGVQALDARAYTVVTLVLAAAATLAAYLPARRAARLDPNLALRRE